MKKGRFEAGRQNLDKLQGSQHHFKKYSYESPQHSQSYGRSSKSDEIFEPQFYAMKKLRIPIKRKTNKGAWTIEENKIYYNFLINHKSSFANQTIRRESRVFCKLSEVLRKKRTPDQCRSHHQKFIGKQDEQIDCLIKRLKQKIDESEQDFLNNRKTRIIGKLRWKRENAMIKREQGLNERINLDQRQIKKVDQRKNYTIITFKDSNHMKVHINEEDIEQYSP